MPLSEGTLRQAGPWSGASWRAVGVNGLEVARWWPSERQLSGIGLANGPGGGNRSVRTRVGSGGVGPGRRRGLLDQRLPARTKVALTAAQPPATNARATSPAARAAWTTWSWGTSAAPGAASTASDARSDATAARRERRSRRRSRETTAVARHHSMSPATVARALCDSRAIIVSCSLVTTDGCRDNEPSGPFHPATPRVKVSPLGRVWLPQGTHDPDRRYLATVARTGPRRLVRRQQQASPGEEHDDNLKGRHGRARSGR